MFKFTSTEDLKEQFKTNKQLRTTTYVVGGIAVLLVGYLGYRQFIFGPENEQSKSAFVTGLNYAAKDSTDKAIESLEPIAKKYNGTVGGENAAFVLARQYMSKGEFQKALDLLEGVDASDTYVSVYATGLQGDCYSELGKYADALDKYEAAASLNENDKTSPEFLFKAGLVCEQLKDFGKASELYEQIRDNYSNFSQQKAIEKYIARTKNKIAK